MCSALLWSPSPGDDEAAVRVQGLQRVGEVGREGEVVAALLRIRLITWGGGEGQPVGTKLRKY